MDSPFDQPTIPQPGGRYQAGLKVFGGRFVLERRIGRGGMGEVWLATDTELGDERALKFLPQEVAADPKALAQLRREAIAGRRLSHPRIVRVDDFYSDAAAGMAAVAMEYVDGKTLNHLQSETEKGYFEVAEIEGWIRDVCEALDYAHGEADVVHRDLKPHNIIIEAATGRAKVLDFGIARRIAETNTQLTGKDSSGTLAYMSPQQVMGERGKPSDDIYSLGATIYELLTGSPPFFRGDLKEQVKLVVPPPMTERRQELIEENAVAPGGESIPETWEKVVASCLEKDSDERPSSSSTVLRLLSKTEAKTDSTDSADGPRAAEVTTLHGTATQPEDSFPLPRPVPQNRDRPGSHGIRKSLWVAAAAIGCYLLVGWILAIRGGDKQAETGKLLWSKEPGTSPAAEPAKGGDMSPKAATVIPAPFLGTWTLNPNGIHPPDGEQPLRIEERSISGHETYGEVEKVTVRSGTEIVVDVSASAEGDEESGVEVVLRLPGEDRLLLSQSAATIAFGNGTYYRVRQGGADASIPPGEASIAKPFENSLGMKFVPAKITGGPTDGKKVLFSIWETRRQDYEVFAKTNTDVDDEWKEAKCETQPVGHELDHPVVSVSWNDARAFCTWLTDRERAEGKIGRNDFYRLPSDHEWSCAVGIGPREDANSSPWEKSGKIEGIYPWGSGWPPPKGFGNYYDEEAPLKIRGGPIPPLDDGYASMPGRIQNYSDGYVTTAPVGSFSANHFGLYDLGGNVWEWCDGGVSHKASEQQIKRGGSWFSGDLNTTASSRRVGNEFFPGEDRFFDAGFRCVLEVRTVGSGDARKSFSFTPGVDPVKFVELGDFGHSSAAEISKALAAVPAPIAGLVPDDVRKGNYGEPWGLLYAVVDLNRDGVKDYLYAIDTGMLTHSYSAMVGNAGGATRLVLEEAIGAKSGEEPAVELKVPATGDWASILIRKRSRDGGGMTQYDFDPTLDGYMTTLSGPESAQTAEPGFMLPAAVGGMKLRCSVLPGSRYRHRNDAMEFPGAPPIGKWREWVPVPKDAEGFWFENLILLAVTRDWSGGGTHQYSYYRTGERTAEIHTHSDNGNGGGIALLRFESDHTGTVDLDCSTRHSSMQFKGLRFELVELSEDEIEKAVNGRSYFVTWLSGEPLRLEIDPMD